MDESVEIVVDDDMMEALVDMFGLVGLCVPDGELRGEHVLEAVRKLKQRSKVIHEDRIQE